MNEKAKAIVLMGVSGCGKTVVGQRLSQLLGRPFFDGDDYHPAGNIAKMASCIPLDDEDRRTWLANLHDLITRHLANGQSLLMACSALKQKYRDQLVAGSTGTIFVFLKGDFELIFERMQTRSGHYMKAEMLRSQFEALEEPTNALTVSIDKNVDAIAKEIIRRLNLISR
jgi:gluconokinase